MATLQTRFDIGQQLWTIKGEKAIRFTVESVSVNKHATFVSEMVYSNDFAAYADKCFATKEELINYLFQDIDEN